MKISSAAVFSLISSASSTFVVVVLAAEEQGHGPPSSFADGSTNKNTSYLSTEDHKVDVITPPRLVLTSSLSSENGRILKKKKSAPKSSKGGGGNASSTTAGCAVDIVRTEVTCDVVTGMEWFLTTQEGMASLQGLTKGLNLEQIRQRTTDPLVMDVVSTDDAPTSTNARMTDDAVEARALKKKKSDKAAAPTPAPTLPGEKVSKCANHLQDPLINCDAIASMMWFLTTDEGIASLQGLTKGMDTEGVIQREAIIFVYTDLNISNVATRERNLAVSFQGNECDWIGITCGTDGKIRKIELNGQNLSGTISSKISKLRRLNVLDLGSNSLSGEIPFQIGELADLNYIDLSNNQLGGNIPSLLGSLQDLQFLYLHENMFTGSFPKEVCLPLRDNGSTVSSDCFGSPPKIVCEWQLCCNICYPLSSQPSPRPSVSMEPSVSMKPSISMRPSVSTKPSVSIMPSVSIKPSVSSKPSISIKPSMQPSVDPWPQRGDDIDGRAGDDYYGWSVSLSSDGTVVAIGAMLEYGKTGNGYVRVYEWNSTTWNQRGDDIDGENDKDRSGVSVSLSSDGTVVAIGAHYNDGIGTDAGHVRVYEWNSTAWNQRGDDIDGEAGGDKSGASVSLSSDGTVVAIGAPYNDGIGPGSCDGHVRVYEWNSTAWNQRGDDIDGEAGRDYFGSSVSLSSNGTIVAIGAWGNDEPASGAGHVRVYEWNGGSAWSQRGDDIDGEAENDQSGASVSLSSDGTVVAIGAYTNDGTASNAGHVRVYEWNSTAWNQRGDDIDGEAAGDWSGYSVSLSSDGTVVAIGAPNNGSGHVRVYEWNSTAWNQLGTDIYGEAAGDDFGSSVSLSSDGTVVAIGAPYNDGNGTDAGHVQVYNYLY